MRSPSQLSEGVIALHCNFGLCRLLRKCTTNVQKVKVVLKNMLFRFFYYFCIENQL